MPLSRRRLFSVLSAHSELAVLVGGPFSGKTTLVNTWLATDPCPEMVPVVVPEPAHDVTPETYWATVASSLCNSLGIDEPVAAERSFDTVCSVLVRHARPVMFVLDGVRSVESIEDRVGQLLQLGPQVRVVATSRAAGSWTEHVDGHPRRTIVAPTTWRSPWTRPLHCVASSDSHATNAPSSGSSAGPKDQPRSSRRCARRCAPRSRTGPTAPPSTSSSTRQ